MASRRSPSQVRRTDHVRVAAASGGVTTDDMFAAFIDSQLARAPEQRFFLATDNRESQRHLLDRYGAGTILFYGLVEGIVRDDDGEKFPPSDLRHTSMKHAVIDLWLLSRCRGVFGSNASTYSEVAMLLADAGHHRLASKLN